MTMTLKQELLLIRDIRSYIRGWSFASRDGLELRIRGAENDRERLSDEGKKIVDQMLKPLKEALKS